MLDYAVLAGGVQALKDHQEGPTVLRVELFLHIAEQSDASVHDVLGVLFIFHAVRVGGVVVLQAKLLTIGNTEGFRQARGLFDEFVVFHDDGSVVHRRGARTGQGRRLEQKESGDDEMRSDCFPGHGGESKRPAAAAAQGASCLIAGRIPRLTSIYRFAGTRIEEQDSVTLIIVVLAEIEHLSDGVCEGIKGALANSLPLEPVVLDEPQDRGLV